MTFQVTYEIVTPESAEQGDCSERGFFSRGGWQHDDPSAWTLHEIISQFGRHSLHDCGRWFATGDGDINYRTGEETSYAVHPPATITASSYRRLIRILTAKGSRHAS